MDDRKGNFSDSYPSVNRSNCNKQILDAIDELMVFLKLKKIQIFKFKGEEEYIAVKIEIPVGLPARGTVNNVDIKRTEPILILFSRNKFPWVAPQIRMDRLDFPVKNIPHLNYVLWGEPPHPCLSRGDIDDWFNEHSVVELVQRIQSWLQDAARGQLIKRIDRFEPSRMDLSNCWGISIFRYLKFSSFINKAWKKSNSNGKAFTESYVLDPSKSEIGPISLFTENIYPELNKLLSNIGNNKSDSEKMVPCKGLLLWSDFSNVITDYFSEFPRNLDGLFSFCKKIGIDLKAEIDVLLQNQTEASKKITLIPVFICIKRNLKLIGLDTPLEILSFMILYSEDYGNNSYVCPLFHNEPITPEFGREISKIQITDDPSILLLGCGALGSKVGLHLVREGLTKFSFVDFDRISPHNLLRSAFVFNSVGENKADVMGKMVDEIFRDDKGKRNNNSYPQSVFELLTTNKTKIIKKADCIIDTSASKTLMSLLIDNHLFYEKAIMRCEIADEGKLGILLLKSASKTPSLEELQVCLYDLAIENPWLEEWLSDFKKKINKNEEYGLENISIGLGCSSLTFKLSDDIISFHGSIFSLIIKEYLTKGFSSRIYLNYINEDPLLKIDTRNYLVEEFTSLIPENSKLWKIRVKKSIVSEMLDRNNANPNETGGILIGSINTKKRVVFITRILDAPPDSKQSPYAFTRGIQDLPECIENIMEKTGDLIYYVGEWHTHRNGSGKLSDTDKHTKNLIKKNLDKKNIPTLIIVVNNKGCYAYIYP